MSNMSFTLPGQWTRVRGEMKYVLDGHEQLSEKHRKPCAGPPDWDLIALNTPGKELEEAENG